MSTDCDANDGPFSTVIGNIVLGGLPRGCGPEIALAHLEEVAALGAVMSKHPTVVERALLEVRTEAATSERANELLCDVVLAVKVRVGARPVSSELPFSAWLPEHLFDESIRAALQFGIVLEVDRSDAFIALVGYFAGPPQRSTATLLRQLPAMDRERWRLPSEWESSQLARADRVSADLLLLGLHELHRMPWSHFGGMVAGRLATDEYLAAFKSLNRDVIVAHILHRWHHRSDETVKQLALNFDDLVGVSVPFPLPPQLTRLLEAVGRHYLNREYAVTVVLARSALEAALNVAMRALRAEPAASLVNQIRQLERSGALSRSQALAADDVRNQGNKAVHDEYAAYNVPQRALQTIRSLVTVLFALRAHIEAPDS